ncbi:hypothetical protein L598_000700000460 [Mesorhizobium sp. J18]|uniref:hypothetical protein n=1 Tax=Mesorhizobium sp. J18 TaxID=935263 RepID=UPI0011995348|nr:hypothetical protein [Mesorhizobium sp. J18]TWG90290.1 hypothetical protein L598_000700000460 [Mesorhizobium sp. J18]
MGSYKPFLPLHVVKALAPFAQKRGNRPVSIAAMVKATRYAVPNLPYGDDVLAELLAKEFIRAGCSIEFDSREDQRLQQDKTRRLRRSDGPLPETPHRGAASMEPDVRRIR